MSSKNNLYYGKFIPENISQWTLFKEKNLLICIASNNIDDKFII